MNLLYLLSTNSICIARLIFTIFPLMSIILLSGPPIALAQELTLFEEIETPRGDNRASGGLRNSDGDIISEPNFVLVGTARFGDHYSAWVNNGNERNIRLDETSEPITFIPGYPGYRLIEVKSGEILLRYPTDRKCVSSREKGVSCGEDNVAMLQLPNAEPIKAATSDGGQGENEAALQLGEGSAEQNISKNPFAALLEEASNSDSSSEETDSFAPRRILPEDVPPGMRVVSTPFGDRLVEE